MSNLQSILEAELKKGIAAAGAKDGWAVMIDAQTLDILAISDEKKVLHCREPGSIMKPLTYSLALLANDELKALGDEPIFTPEEWIASSDGHFPGRIAPLKDGKVHKFLNFPVAMQKSSNIYSARTVQRTVDRMGKRWFREQLMAVFGLGCGAGYLPNPDNGSSEWSVSTSHVLGLGYSLLVNSLQMVKAYAMIAANPRFSPIVQAMKYVTKPGGTSLLADIPHFSEAGKSGTAEKVIGGKYSKSCNVSSFIGFAPSINPRFVLLISLDEPVAKMTPAGMQQFGGVCSGPIFREIGYQSLQHFGITPDNPHNTDLMDEVERLSQEYLKRNNY